MEVPEIKLQQGSKTMRVVTSRIASILHSGQDGRTQIRDIAILLSHRIIERKTLPMELYTFEIQ